MLGFVLGALDATEQQQIQEQIDNDPELEEALIEIKNSLLPLEAIDSPTGPPAGLARRTCESVANSSNSPKPSPAPVDLAESKISFAGRGGWSLMDFMVTAGVLLVMLAILIPALAMSRHNSRLTACQSNLNSIGSAFISFSEMNDGEFPSIPIDGNLSAAGCYAPILKQVSLINEDSIFACPGLGSDRETPICIPTVEMIQSSDCKVQSRHFREIMGGDFAYSLGYEEDGKYRTPSRMGRSNYVLLADKPSCRNLGKVSNNHAGRGQNVLFEDGRVAFIVGGFIGEDAIYENNLGLVAPGADRYDSVVASSWLAPILSTRCQQSDE
jgi:hypothetical protein